VVNDFHGNAVATVPQSGTVQWSSTRVTGYGPAAGYDAPTLSLNTSLAEATIWRSRRIDPTGLYWLGARYYDPMEGRFLSPDPMGHWGSMDLYSYANGDPVNGMDPDGRLTKWAAQQHQINSEAAFASGWGLGDAMRVAGDHYSELGTYTKSTGINFVNNMHGTFWNMAGGIITPKSYVDGYHHGVDRAANVMAGEMVDGNSGVWAFGQGASTLVGDGVGYNGVMEAGFGVDRESREFLQTSDRWSRGLMGSSQMIFTGTGLRAGYQPKVSSTPPPLPVAPSMAAAGTDAHKASRWQSYQERGGKWDYERWSNVYDSNMTRALDANRAVDAFHRRLGWGKREVTLDVEGIPRRLDIADVATRRGIEHKTGYQTRTQANLWELTRDEILVKKGWVIEWVFEGTASKPLLEALEKAGIKVAK
jgi:RHS repeat-associated protein